MLHQSLRRCGSSADEIYIYEFRQNIHLILLPPYINLALISVITTMLTTESHGKQSKQVFTADFRVALRKEDPEVDSQASLTQTHRLKLQRMEARNICPSDDHLKKKKLAACH